MKLIGTRSDVDKLFAIGSIKEVFRSIFRLAETLLTITFRISLGMILFTSHHWISMLMLRGKRSINARILTILGATNPTNSFAIVTVFLGANLVRRTRHWRVACMIN